MTTTAPSKRRRLLWPVVLLLVAGLAVGAGVLWKRSSTPRLPAGIAAGNGRLEATRIDIAAKFAGRVAEVLVKEGDRVSAGQVLARMDADSPRAQLHEAEAQVANLKSAKATAVVIVSQRQGARSTAEAIVAQRESDLALAQKQFERTQALVTSAAVPQQQFDIDASRLQSAQAMLAAAKSQAEEARTAIDAARAQVEAAQAAVDVAIATTQRIKTDLLEAELKAPRAGRIQHRLIEPGEVIGAGGKLLSLIDLNDVYMTVFLSETDAGKLEIGSEGRLVLDAAPQLVIPAKVSYVAAEAQFTPKTVETNNERQKLVFEVRLQLEPEALEQYAQFVKVGLPGFAYVRVDRTGEWPQNLSLAQSAPPAARP